MPDDSLRINEIFHSLQGESSQAGRPCTFVRLTGCPLRCNYCDTEYAFHEGDWMSLDAVTEAVRRLPGRLVEITGGEPLSQKNVISLMHRLLEDGFEVMLETSGAYSVAEVPEAVRKIVDFKTPDSGMSSHNDLSNLEYMTEKDEVKFVIQSRRDYEWSRDLVSRHRIDERYTVLFSPVWDSGIQQELADWMLQDASPARYQLQLHKVLWPDKERGF